MINENLYEPIKSLSTGASLGTLTVQFNDSIKAINNRIIGLQDQISELTEAKPETFKYITGTLSKNRTFPNKNGEVSIVSSNNTVDVKVDNDKIDMRTKNFLTEQEVESVVNSIAVLVDGSKKLTAPWDAGSHKITAEQFESNVAAGTAPFVVASNTLVSNLNADLWDGYEFSDYFDQVLKTTSSPDFVGVTCDTLGISVNTALTTPQVSIVQTGTGDAAIKFSAGGTSYAFGVDNSNNDILKMVVGTSLSGTDFNFSSAGLRVNNLGVGTPPIATTGVIVALNETTTSSVVGMEIDPKWTPSANTTGDFFGLKFRGRLEGTRNIDEFYGIRADTRFGGSNTVNNTMSAFKSIFSNYGNPSATIATYKGIWLNYYNNSVPAVTVSGDAAQIYLEDYSGTHMSVSGTAYSIYQEGTEINRLGGEFRINSNASGLRLGASNQVELKYDATNFCINPKVSGSGVALLDTDSKVCFRSTSNGINSSAAGILDIFATTTVKVAARLQATTFGENIISQSSPGAGTYSSASIGRPRGYLTITVTGTGNATHETRSYLVSADANGGVATLLGTASDDTVISAVAVSNITVNNNKIDITTSKACDALNAYFVKSD
jgi:hypothetical protein